VRIVVVSANQSIVGGGETYLAWLLAALLRRGHEVAFAFEQSAENPDRAVDRGLELRRWHIRAVPRAEFLAEIRAFQPEIVFLNACEDETLDLELATRFRSVLFAHAFYAACATGWRVHQFPTRQICTRRFGPACIPTNYLRGCGTRNPKRLLTFYSKQRARSEVLRRLSGLVVASHFMRELYMREGLSEGQIRIIPPPAEHEPDLAPPEARAVLSRVLFLGRLTSGKGGATAIEATALCEQALGRPLHLTIAGEGPELARCKQLASRVALSVQFAGWVGPEQRTVLLRAADVLLVPSLWPEPFGMVGLEAASVGLPAVGYAAGGIVDWLRPGQSGELAESAGFNAHGLARALARALGNPEHHRQLQLGAWRMAHEFGGEQHISRLEQFFGELLGR
jgi:glycosyltransferase involved in cell wall biosynthesis